jgi:hypothetical protein
MAEKYWSGVKGLALNLYASGNGSLCLGTTDHHDTHATLLRLRRCSSGTGLARRNDEATVVISRQCKGARKSVIIGTNSAALGLGCVKTPKSNLRVEISCRFRQFENQQR